MDKPMEAKDYAIGLHVIMKQSGWYRWKGHTLSEDQESIMVDTEDGRTFIIEVREATGGEEPFDAEALERTLNELSRPILIWRLARGILSAGAGQEKGGRDIGAEKRCRSALLEAHKTIMDYARGRRS